jgi:glycosyltransferase involved in cell wall biosynthesis
MKVLQIYKSYYPETTGGVEQVIHQLCMELPKHGIQSDVAVCSQSPILSGTETYRVYRYQTTLDLASCPMSLSFLKNFEKLCNQYDLIHYHFPWPFADFMQIVTQNNTPYIVTYHSDIIKQRFLKIPYTPLMHRFLTNAQKIVATSPNYILSSPVLKAYTYKTIVIPLGLSKEAYATPSEGALASWKAILGTDFFLFVGVLRYYKGVQYLIEAAQYTDAHIVIAGRGPEEAHYKTLTQKLGVENITFLGYISDEDKYALLTLCKVVIAPAHVRSEAFCLSLLEGLIYNKPCISTEIGTGTSFVNQHDKTGIVVPPADPRALAVAINILKTNGAYYKELQNNIEAHYTRCFTVEKMVEEYIHIYSLTKI